MLYIALTYISKAKILYQLIKKTFQWRYRKQLNNKNSIPIDQRQKTNTTTQHPRLVKKKRIKNNTVTVK